MKITKLPRSAAPATTEALAPGQVGIGITSGGNLYLKSDTGGVVGIRDDGSAYIAHPPNGYSIEPTIYRIKEIILEEVR